ncbi:MAG: glycosyltransferase family 4 protein [Candidatus Omnitrophica bacterium]|nr:glycosyltransferase family 4 protein [Candidatus Omnitrophota bacterium]
MNILLLTTRLNLGGIGVYVATLACALKKRGHKVIVASSGGELEDILKSKGIEHVHISINTSSEIGPHVMIAAMKLLKIIRKENIQLIHAQTRVAQVIAQYLEKFSKVTFVTTCHGFFKRRFIRILLPCWGRRVIAISDAVREHLVNTMKVSKENIELVYNGIDASVAQRHYSKEEITAFKKEFNLKADKVIGITARMSSVKGHIYLLMAMPKIKQAFPDIQLFMVGSGDKKYEDKLKTMCARLKIEESVIFHPSIRDIHKALVVMDIFVLPSVQEGLGLSILEALAGGLAVVASNVGGIYSVIKHEENGILVPPKDHAALADAVIRLLKDEALAKAMGKRGIEIVNEKFTIDKMVKDTEAFYLRALENR